MEYLERRVGLVNRRLESVIESTDPEDWPANSKTSCLRAASASGLL